jgi:hypothetical protein
MKKRESSESIAKELLFIKNSLQILSIENSGKNKEILDQSIEKFDEVIKFFKGIKKVILVLLTLVLVFVFSLIISIIYKKQAKTLNYEIDDIRTDTIANQILEVRKVMLPDSTYSTTYDYRTRNNKVISYNQLLKEIDSLKLKNISKDLKINSLKDDVSTSKNKIELAEEQYGIRFWNSYQIEKKKKIEYINIESKTIDSALILLEVYRNKLFYNKESKKWEIK